MLLYFLSFCLLLETMSAPFKNDELHAKLPTSDPVCSGETSISIRDIIIVEGRLKPARRVPLVFNNNNSERIIQREI